MYSIFSPQNIKSNTSSMIGQYSLNKNSDNLTKNIVQLSTGIRINSGRDDPTGFVASSILSKEIASMSQAIINCQTANSLCATVDSALTQINTMLNDIRGLITEAANTGVENEAMIAALQLQVDANLDSIDRIANSTQFIDKKLLDGSLDFVTFGLDKMKTDFLQINQANFLGGIEKGIAVKVITQARQAELFYNHPAVMESTTFTVGGTLGFENLSFEKGARLEHVAQAVNLISDSTGVAAKVQTEATNGSIMISSVGKDNDIIVTASKPGSKEGNFVIKFTAPREGNDELKLHYTEGVGNDPGIIEVVLQTEPTVGNGPVTVKTTAEQVVNLLNNSPLLRDANGDGILSASLPDCSSGLGTVTAFDEYAYYGDVLSENGLQFLGLGPQPVIQFTSTPGTSLGIDSTSNPPRYDYAVANVQGLDPNTSFALKALRKEATYDGIDVKFVDSPDESVAFDAVNGTVVFSIDFTGRKNAGKEINMLELQEMVENDPVIGDLFRFVPETSYDAKNPPKLTNDAYLGINATMGTFSGGLVDPGILVIHLETDENGIVKTTANDLIRYFDHPSTQEEADLITRLGLSVSNVCNSSGCGLLAPTYDPNDICADRTGMSPNITFTSSGWETQNERFAGTMVIAAGGINSVFSITAAKHDAALTGSEVLVVYDDTGPKVSYDTISKQLTIGINPTQPVTAKELVDLINGDSKIAGNFTASLPKSVPGSGEIPDGSGLVSIGDHGRLTMPPPTRNDGAPMLCNSDAAAVGLIFYSTDYGSSAFADIKGVNQNVFPVTDRFGNTVERSTGVDIVATINNQLAVGTGRTASISTTDLDMAITINADVKDGSLVGFRITGGGALMQLGPNADPSQQTRLAFRDIHTTAIGGPSGSLAQIRLGGEFDLSTNTNGAYMIVQESILQISMFRGRVGAFQKYEITRNLEQMTDGIEIASAANSLIKDTDFATTISELNRNQLLIETSTNILRYPTDNMRQLLQLLGR